MSDSTLSGFGKFVPGFEFLQNLAGQAAGGVAQSLGPSIPQLGNWVAPTFSVDDLEKRIGEMRAVHFWLDQNAKALAASIQALEVQKMTLVTLKNMNFSMGDVVHARKVQAASEAPAAAPAGGVVDPMQWWGALSQQFQHIATHTMKDVAQQSAPDTTGMAAEPASQPGAKKAPARKRPAARPMSTGDWPMPGAAPAPKAPAKSAVKQSPAKKPAAPKAVPAGRRR